MTPMRDTDGRVHFSQLKLHSRSPAHVRLACTVPRESTRSMVVGSVADARVFGHRSVAVYPGKRQGREWLLFEAAHAGELICTQSEWDDAAGAADAVQEDHVAQDLLRGCELQPVVQWEAHGLPCASGIAGKRGGFDAIDRARGRILDLKLTDSEPETLSRHALQQLWHAQGAWYLDGANAGSDVPRVTEFVLIAVDPKPPHNVTCMRVPDALLDKGRRQIAMWAERHRSCENSGHWPGYVQSVVDLTMPGWMAYGDLQGLEDE